MLSSRKGPRPTRPHGRVLHLVSNLASPRRTRGIALGLALSLWTCGHALAAPNPAKALYDKGATEYNLGHFAEAIANFEKAYELDPAPILLFNIAQSHRQSGNNERALFFYRRYLEQAAPDASNRADVEKRVKDLEEMLTQQSEIKRKPPTQVEDRERHSPPSTAQTTPTPGPVVAPPAAPGPTAPLGLVPPPVSGQVRDRDLPPANPPPQEPVGVATTSAPAPSHDHPFRVGADLGVAFSQFHGVDLEQPGQFSVRVFGGYLIPSLPFPLEVGAAFGFSPLPYKTTLGDEKTASLSGLWARAAALFPLQGGLDLTGELGVGVVWFGGIEANNPFTKDGTSATGAIPMPSFRLAVGARYQLPANLFVYALPAFSYSKTTSGLSDSISSVTRFELPIGVGITF